MNKSLTLVTASLALLSLLAMGVYSKQTQAQAPQQYPIVDAVAQKSSRNTRLPPASSCGKREARKLHRNPSNLWLWPQRGSKSCASFSSRPLVEQRGQTNLL